MLRGSCLCGAVTYAVAALDSPMVMCHCRTCRKAHASAFNVGARVRGEDFRWTRGEDVVAQFESSPGKHRWFCPRCGSHLAARREGEAHWVLRVGSLDDDPGDRPRAHIWVSDNAPWFPVEDDLPRFDEAPPAR